MNALLSTPFISLFVITLSSVRLEGTENLSDQLPPGKTLADLGLGVRPFGPMNRAVRLVEWAVLPTEPPPSYCQQVAAQGNKLYFAIKRGQILEYALDGIPSADPFLDVAALRGENFIDQNSSYSYGIRGFAFHPAYLTNHLVYTLHCEANTGASDLHITSGAHSEFVLAEWNMSGETPAFREVFRIGFETGNAHRAQNIGFNPVALPGEADYGMLYCCFGDNSENGIIDIRNNGQNFSNVSASVIRIHPLAPTIYDDAELAGQGLKRATNNRYSIPLDNPWVGRSGFAEELFAKGFRNPVTMNFAPNGAPMVGDTGELAMEEINLIENGGNYGWSLREGTFAFTMSNQTNGAVLDANDSLTWIPYGNVDDPAYSIYFRDRNGMNPRIEAPTRSGDGSDGLVYPVAQYSHEGNNTSGAEGGASAIVAGQYYSGYWAEELEGLYLFGDLSMDTLYYVEIKDLRNDSRPASVYRLPLIDSTGTQITLESLIGQQRADMRFGRDSYGNVYLVSKTNFKIYRFQGTPEVDLSIASMELPEDGKVYPLLSLTHPGPDCTLTYGLESSIDLSFTDAGAGFVETGSVTNVNGTVEEVFRYLTPIEVDRTRFFRAKIQTAP